MVEQLLLRHSADVPVFGPLPEQEVVDQQVGEVGEEVVPSF
jgi:hypothetical protein